jgi:twinkle protein
MTNIFEWNLIDRPKEKGTGKRTCPSCSAGRKNKADKCLYVNFNDGVAKCFNCDALSFKTSTNTTFTEKTYKTPPKSFKTIKDDSIAKQYFKNRGISAETLSKLYVTFETYYQPQLKSEVDNIVFNYYENSNLVNKKYRGKNKSFTQTTGGKPIFYNINSIIGCDEVYICEGEIDVLSLVEIGIKNAISVPNGANDNDEYWINCKEQLKHVKKYIIATDKDEKGIQLRNNIAQRVGRYRCSFIEFEGKDANEDLVSGVLKETIKNQQHFKVNDTFRVSDLMGGILDLYDNGLPDTLQLTSSWSRDFNKIFSVLNNQLTTTTGIPSHGKSNWIDWYVFNLINDNNLKGSWFSPEHSPNEMYQTNMIEKIVGKPFWKGKENHNVSRITKEEIAEYKEWAEEKIYLTSSEEDVPTWDWLFEKFKEQMFSFGINVFVIDAWNKVLLPQGNKLDETNKVLTKLTSFCQRNNVNIFLIAHPTKMQKDDSTGLYKIPSLYDVSGSADFRNQTHNGLTVYRYFDDENTGAPGYTKVLNTKTKFNFQGEIGKSIDFMYVPENGRFYPDGYQGDRYSPIYKTESKVIKPKEDLTKHLPDDLQGLF